MSTSPPAASTLAKRRAPAEHASMFWRMLVRAAVLRRGRTAGALAAMVVAAATATAMLNLFVDVQAKLRTEFRKYGANIVLIARDGQELPAEAQRSVDAVVRGRGLAVPFSYVVARTSTGQPVVVAGTDFNQVRRLDGWWSVTAWPSAPQEALLGVRAAAALNLQGKAFDLSFGGHTIHLNSAGIVRTGAAEDSRIYVALADFKGWTGVSPTTIEIALSGSAQEVNDAVGKLAQALPSAEVQPVRQVTEAEARVLGKTRATLLAAAVLIILTAALGVLATLTGWVFDRRRDFAIMKALGASDRLIMGFFAAEAAALGGAGGLIGYVLGVGVAAWIGRANFHAPVVPRLIVLPPILLGSVGVALLAALLPISLLRRVQPAIILRGE